MKLLARSVLFLVLATTLYEYLLTIVQDISLNTKEEDYMEEKWFGTNLVNRGTAMLTNVSENSGNRDRNPNGQTKSTIKQPTK